MGKYIKKFETQAAYEAFKASENYVTPNVSWCLEQNSIKSEPWTAPQHDYIEIAGIKWATMNIGATAVTDYGLYFQWGDTQGYTAAQCGSGEGQKYFAWEDYKYCNGTHSPGATGMTKYNSTDGLTTLQLSDDAVNAAWGGNWRMPTSAETMALGAAVTTAWTEDYQGSGVKGMICTDNTDNSKVLFFPAAGYCANGSFRSVGINAGCWSGSLHSTNGKNGRTMAFNSGTAYWTNYSERSYGFTLRGVLDE